MNQDQFLSAIRSLLKLAGGALMAHGLTEAASWVNAQDTIGAIVTLAALWWSHWQHGSDTPPSSTSTPNKTP